MSVLKKLVLSGNHIYDAGAIAIGESLKTNSTLEELELASCEIGTEGGKAIGVGLQAGIVVLTDLDLHYNDIGPDGAKALPTHCSRARGADQKSSTLIHPTKPSRPLHSPFMALYHP